jgi:small multidrug resistance family-3 protein
MNLLAWLVFLAAALLEVGGDAAIWRGLRGKVLGLVVAGIAALGCYGLLVNSMKWEFSKLLGIYVGFFALVSVLCSRFFLGEHISRSTWCGLALILAGSLIIQFGRN